MIEDYYHLLGVRGLKVEALLLDLLVHRIKIGDIGPPKRARPKWFNLSREWLRMRYR